jgi:hypothetical protein
MNSTSNFNLYIGATTHKGHIFRFPSPNFMKLGQKVPCGQNIINIFWKIIFIFYPFLQIHIILELNRECVKGSLFFPINE